MAKVIYVGSDDPTDNTECTVFGLTFTRGEAVEIDSPDPRLLGNPTFLVESDAEADEATTIREQLGTLGAAQPGARAGLPKLRQALADALAAQPAPEPAPEAAE